jgi:hypothetical protein
MVRQHGAQVAKPYGSKFQKNTTLLRQFLKATIIHLNCKKPPVL